MWRALCWKRKPPSDRIFGEKSLYRLSATALRWLVEGFFLLMDVDYCQEMYIYRKGLEDYDKT